MGMKRWITVSGGWGLAVVLVHGDFRHLDHPESDHAHSVTTIRVEPRHEAILDHTHLDAEGFVALELPGDIAAITTGSVTLTPPPGAIAMTGMAATRSMMSGSLSA